MGWRGRFGIFGFWILWFLEMAGDEKTALPEGKSGSDFALRGERWREI